MHSIPFDIENRRAMRSRISAAVRKMLALGWLALLAATAQAQQDDIARQIEQLNRGDEPARIAAIDALAQQGAAAKDATPALAALLADPSAAVRAHAAHALLQIGPEARSAAPALAKAISDSDDDVQRMAIAALEQIKPDPAVVVEALGKALQDNDPAVRVEALAALTEYSESAVKVLSQALGDPAVRYWAALALGELGPKAKDAAEPLAAALKDERPEVRREVLIALARIGPGAAAAVPAIAAQLQDKDAPVRNAAAFALGSMGTAAASAAEALRNHSHSEDELECTVCAWALARIDPADKAAKQQAVEMLLGQLKSKNPRVQAAALRGLLDLETDPKQVVPLLAEVIEKGQPEAVSEALGALSVLGEQAVPVLDEALSRPEARARAAMLVALLGAKAKDVVPALVTALDDKNEDTRREVLLALAAIGPDAAPAIGGIQASLSDPEPRIKATAAYALGRIGPAAKAALPTLRSEMTSPDSLVRVASAYAVVHVAPGDERLARDALPVLIQGLQNPLAPARRGAAEALAVIGKPARVASERALRAAAQDPDESVRKAALMALERMGAMIDAKPAVPVRVK
jgi:HEAT repeat protein